MWLKHFFDNKPEGANMLILPSSGEMMRLIRHVSGVGHKGQAFYYVRHINGVVVVTEKPYTPPEICVFHSDVHWETRQVFR